MRKVLMFVVLIMTLVLNTNSFANNVKRILEIENKKNSLELNLQQYQAQVQANIRQTEIAIFELNGAIKELKQQDMEERNAERAESEKSEGNAGKITGGDTEQSGNLERRVDTDNEREGNPPESPSPESGGAEEGQEGKADTHSG